MAHTATASVAPLLLALLIAAALQSDGTRAALARRHAGPRAALSPDDYFASLVDQFDDAVRSVGFYSLLPINDFVIELDQVVYGVELKGQCNYTFGYVTNMDPFLVGKDSFGGTTSFDGYLRGYVDMPNIEVIYDFHATLTIGNFQGSATHIHPNNRILVTVERNTTIDDSKPEASAMTWSVASANYTSYIPDNNVTRALARVARLKTGIHLWDDITAWCNATFPPLLQQIVDSMEFPL